MQNEIEMYEFASFSKQPTLATVHTNCNRPKLQTRALKTFHHMEMGDSNHLLQECGDYSSTPVHTKSILMRKSTSGILQTPPPPRQVMAPLHGTFIGTPTLSGAETEETGDELEDAHG